MTIKAVRKEENAEENKEHQIVRRERRYGEYVRRFYVQDIAEEEIRASLKDGVLKLEVPKRQKCKVNASRFKTEILILRVRSLNKHKLSGMNFRSVFRDGGGLLI